MTNNIETKVNNNNGENKVMFDKSGIIWRKVTTPNVEGVFSNVDIDIIKLKNKNQLIVEFPSFSNLTDLEVRMDMEKRIDKIITDCIEGIKTVSENSFVSNGMKGFNEEWDISINDYEK